MDTSEGQEESTDALAGVLSEALIEKLPALAGMPRPVLRECVAGAKLACFRHSHVRVEQVVPRPPRVLRVRPHGVLAAVVPRILRPDVVAPPTPPVLSGHAASLTPY